MKFNFTNKLGFTLVELLVVIAIIGILSSVAVVNLNSARDKARQAAVEQTLAGIRPIALLCLSDDYNLYSTNEVTYCTGGESPSSDTHVCASSGDVFWPDLSEYGWGWIPCNSDFAAGTYSFSAAEKGGMGPTAITCDQNSCIVTSI